MTTVLLFSILPAVLAVIFGGILVAWVNKQAAGDEKMKSIAKAIQDGAKAY